MYDMINYISEISQLFLEPIASRTVIFKVLKKWKICERTMIPKEKP